VLKRITLSFGCLLCCLSAPVLAQTTCSASEQFTLNWTNQTQGAQGTGSKSYTASDGLGHNETATFSYSGATSAFVGINFGAPIGTVTTPYIGVINVGGVGATDSTLTLGTIFGAYETNIDSGSNHVAVNMSFSKPIREIRFTLLDIDYTANQFRDWIKVTGNNGTVTPALSSPYGGRNNSTNPGQTAPSTTLIGPYTASVPNFGSAEVVGNTGNSTNVQDLGNISAQFATPVTQVTIRYANGPAAYIGGTPGQQAIAIHNLYFCTMPQITVTKTSATVATTGINKFSIPGSDVDYTITVTNTGGSPVDINATLIADLLPSNVTFFNGDIDTATAGTQNFIFNPGTSGLTLAAGNITYSSTGSAPYSYTPVAGYDALVKGLRFQPAGTMAANSSFSVIVRTRVN
jgi:uncharacterized repeat protein (TIGR01451 family)